MGRETRIKIDFNRRQHDHDIGLKWPTKQQRPYYGLEQRFTQGQGTILLNLFQQENGFIFKHLSIPYQILMEIERNV